MGKKKVEVAAQYPKMVETFDPPQNYQLDRMVLRTEPSAFNGIVKFKKYRIIVEEVVEPVEILQERLEKLWVESDNHHHWQPLTQAAISIGYTFKGQHGSQRPKK